MNTTSFSHYVKIIEQLAINKSYFRRYSSIISNAKCRASTRKETKKILDYVEEHHIVPTSFKKGNKKDVNNTVFLNGREHFVVHKLLAEMFVKPSREYFKMQEALSYFSNNTNRNLILNSRDIEHIRKANSIASSERNKGNQHYKKRKPDNAITRKAKGITATKSRWVTNLEKEYFTQDFQKYIDNGFHFGRLKMRSETKEKLKITGFRHTGLKRSLETREKISKASASRKWVNNGIKQSLAVNHHYLVENGYQYGQLKRLVAL